MQEQVAWCRCARLGRDQDADAARGPLAQHAEGVLVGAVIADVDRQHVRLAAAQAQRAQQVHERAALVPVHLAQRPARASRSRRAPHNTPAGGLHICVLRLSNDVQRRAQPFSQHALAHIACPATYYVTGLKLGAGLSRH